MCAPKGSAFLYANPARILKNYLYNRYWVGIPILNWNGHTFVRISVQGYNTEKDMLELINGIRAFYSENR